MSQDRLEKLMDKSVQEIRRESDLKELGRLISKYPSEARNIVSLEFGKGDSLQTYDLTPLGHLCYTAIVRELETLEHTGTYKGDAHKLARRLAIYTQTAGEGMTLRKE